MNASSRSLKREGEEAYLYSAFYITACTVVQAVVKATSQSNGKGQILTPWGSETPEPWAAKPRGVRGDNVPPTFKAKKVQGGTMKMMYSSQFRLYSGVRQGSILFHLLFNIYRVAQKKVSCCTVIDISMARQWSLR